MKDFICLDLETTSKNADEAEIKVVGMYDPIPEDDFSIYKWSDKALAKTVQVLQDYQNIITFNGGNYDLPILERHGVPLKFRHIDVRDVVMNRSGLIMKGGFDHYSLREIVNVLGLDEFGKGDIDYEIFKKEVWSPEEQEQIDKYCRQDLVLTYKIWKYLMDKFEVFGRFISKEDREKYKHITSPLKIYGYKFICFGSGIDELYDENPKSRDFPEKYSNTPRKHFSNNAVLLKFNYLFANTVIQNNLLSFNCDCCNFNEGKFHGSGIYNVKGFYCRKRQGRVEKFLKDIYLKSREDPEIRLVVGTVFNQLYNIMTNASFYSLYNPTSVMDAIAISKHQIEMMVDKFKEFGYFVMNVDGDNIFIDLEEGQTLEGLLTAKAKVVEYLRSKNTFPSETFDIFLKDELKYLQFFKKGDSPFLYKGQYLYITKEDKVVSKGINKDEEKEIVEKVIINGN